MSVNVMSINLNHSQTFLNDLQRETRRTLRSDEHHDQPRILQIAKMGLEGAIVRNRQESLELGKVGRQGLRLRIYVTVKLSRFAAAEWVSLSAAATIISAQPCVNRRCSTVTKQVGRSWAWPATSGAHLDEGFDMDSRDCSGVLRS